jgi:hypothetical protein
MTIELTLVDNTWYARFVDDPTILTLFGTDVLPTAFTAAASPWTVAAALLALNPNARIEVIAP